MDDIFKILGPSIVVHSFYMSSSSPGRWISVKSSLVQDSQGFVQGNVEKPCFKTNNKTNKKCFDFKTKIYLYCFCAFFSFIENIPVYCFWTGQ